MPSPDYPSEIENIEGNIEFKVEGKNRANINKVTTANTNNWGVSVDGEILIIEHKNTYTDGTPILNLELNEGTYYLSLNENNGISLYVDNMYKTILYNNSSFVVEDGKKYVLRFVNSQQSTLTYTNLMISNYQTEYEPYKSQVVTFPLGEEKLMEGSYLADDGIHNVRGQIILDGTESGYDVYGTNSGLKLSNSTLIKGKTYNGNVVPEVLCNYLIKQKRTFIFTGAVDNSISINNNEIFFRLTNIATTVAELKTYLAEQYANGTPLIIEYELAEPETVPYTAEQQEAWDKIESMKLYDGVNHIESTSEIDIKYNYIYKKPSIKNKSDIENKISSGEYQTIINNKRYFVFLEEELKSVRNDITDRLYIDTNKNIAKVMKRVDKLVLNGTEEWNVNATHSNVFYTTKPKNMADNETNIFCTITDEFSKDLSGETYGILIDTNINIKIPKVKTVADLKAYLAKEPITIQYKATEEIKDIILLSKPSSYWTTCEDEFKYPQMQKTTNKRGCVVDVIGEEIDVFCKTNKEQFEKIATHKNATGYAVNRIKKKKWKSIQLKFSSNKSFELFSCTLESYIGSYIKR